MDLYQSKECFSQPHSSVVTAVIEHSCMTRISRSWKLGGFKEMLGTLLVITEYDVSLELCDCCCNVSSQKCDYCLIKKLECLLRQ